MVANSSGSTVVVYSSVKLNFWTSYGQKTVFANFDQAPLKNNYLGEELI